MTPETNAELRDALAAALDVLASTYQCIDQVRREAEIRAKRPDDHFSKWAKDLEKAQRKIRKAVTPLTK
jgi:hypothetical protein